jgi:hypothetical protein
MGDTGMAMVVLPCVNGPEPANLKLELLESQGCQAFGRLRLELPASDWSIDLPCAFVGQELLQFATRLSEIHDRLAGCARLLSFDEGTEITVTITGPHRGTATVAGKCKWLLPGVGYGSSIGETSQNPTVQLQFDGFYLDQSYLPDIAGQLHQTIIETGVLTESPWYRNEGEKEDKSTP